MSDAPVTLFIPFGNGYGKPGITFRADTVDELTAIMRDLNSQSDPDAESKLSVLLNDVKTVTSGVQLVFPQEDVAKPAQRPTSSNSNASAPADAPSCEHGAMKFKSGTNAKGAWKGWFCPQPYGSVQCKPQFIK